LRKAAQLHLNTLQRQLDWGILQRTSWLGIFAIQIRLF
jgi:hypothetical protein